MRQGLKRRRKGASETALLKGEQSKPAARPTERNGEDSVNWGERKDTPANTTEAHRSTPL